MNYNSTLKTKTCVHIKEEFCTFPITYIIFDWEDGETVEMAGSLNVWQHSVKLDPKPSSNITDLVEMRFPTLFISGKPCL